MNIPLSTLKQTSQHSTFYVKSAAIISNNIIEIEYYDFNNKHIYSLLINRNLTRIYSFLNINTQLQKKVAIEHFQSNNFKDDILEVFKGNVTLEKIV